MLIDYFAPQTIPSLQPLRSDTSMSQNTHFPQRVFNFFAFMPTSQVFCTSVRFRPSCHPMLYLRFFVRQGDIRLLRPYYNTTLSIGIYRHTYTSIQSRICQYGQHDKDIIAYSSSLKCKLICRKSVVCTSNASVNHASDMNSSWSKSCTYQIYSQ